MPRDPRVPCVAGLGRASVRASSPVAGALAAGGTLVTDRFAPMWWVLADPEGNEADVATVLQRD